ncbi:uncharacterized protein [Ptychodera flava]|uniref:uncharacterized protein n=1 Tax=Ptychodera flava TaxID=63121 RepID=UPI00396A4170
MSYYSSKVYGMTKHSRYYQIDRDVIFNFTAPVPSARFHMIIPSDSSGDIDFPVYSSSDPTHQVMVNLRNASQVKFELELVVPKIICNVTIVMDLPQGNGFTFKSVELTKLGSKIQFPHSKLSNDSITEDLHGNSYFFAELRGLHSVPELIYYPREFDDFAKQKKFKTMKGEEDPYPTYPSCSSLNSEDYEKYLLQGCFLDTTHYFEVTMVTADHAENYNLTQNMTHGNCVQLCRSDGYFYSGTKNGTDCYCGNRTHLELYHDNATVIYTPANQTVLESYYVTVYEACNITYQDSTNKTMIEICQDTAVYQNCTKKEFENCKNSTFFECFQSMTDSCDDQALSQCGDSGDENCIAMENESCRSSADATCQTQAKAVCSEKVIRECKSVAAETYRIRQLDFCRQTLYENCTQEMYTTCNETFSQICSNMAMQRCESPVTWQCYRDQYKNCTVSSNVNCTNLVLEACNNITYFGCQSETIPAHNSTVQECVTTELSNCSICLNQTTQNCIQNNSSDNCSTHASTVCSKWCQFISCADVMIEIAESYVYNNCSLVELISFNATYLGNCSHEELRWKNVTYIINVPYYIQMSDCNVTCTGDSNTTCGGRDYITIYGPMYSSVVEQTCDWYTGLHQRDEDVLTLEFAFSIDALSTKGVTEILHPHVSYDHGQDRIPTAIPFAPYLLEAGDVILDMTVSVSPSHDGFYPGDILEYYTEVRHNPLSTVTARDVHVVWLFPYYVEFIELFNHKMAASKDACRDTIPVTAQTTTPDESFKFHVSTLHNTDCISFHFSIRIDPNNELTQGYYHLVALSETYYYSWDIHNPYEDDFKHNILVHYHDIIPTSVKFEVPSKYTGRPELEDLKLSTYNFLYDEQHNIMYACFFNNTMHVYEGGCFMVGVLPVYYTEVPHTCEQYCNCTFQGGIPSNANCTDYDPKPDNCSCGCVPDCYEFFDLCELSCYTNCTNCTLDDIDLCVDGCRRTLTNCSQECCIGDCDVVLDVCLFNCTNCTSQSNCTAELNSTAAVVDHNCTVECFQFHGLCSYHCVKEPNTCYDNCTDMSIACSDLCDSVECNPSIYPDDSEGQQNCTIQCYHQCSTDHVNCSKECCFEECSYNFTQCMDNCLLCGDDFNCSVSCNLTCQHQYGNCSYECDPVPKTCRENCTIDQAMCQEPCLAKCSAETCESLPGPSCASENVTLNSTNCTSSENHQSCGNISESCLHEEICSSTTDTVCLQDCEGKCDTTYSDCQDLCCVEDCSEERQACNSNCTEICQGDRLCLWQCRNNCTDLYDVCSHRCTFPDWICKNNCSDEYNLCLWGCPDESVAAAQNISNSTVSNAALSNTVVSNTSVVSCGLNITQSNTSSNCSTLNCREHCNATYQNCTRGCPCAEPCSLTHKDCWLACNGCENNCERICRGDCEISRGICSSECIAEQSGIPNDCLALCGTNVTAFVISCATNMTNNQTFADCVSQSVQNSTQCSQSCYRYLGIEDCSLCEMQIQNCSSICSKEKCSINDTRCHENCTVNCTSLNSQCFQNCNMVYPSTLAECWNSCNDNITSCLHPCLDCNDTSCNPAECSTTCLESHRLCSRTCHRKFVSPGCDDKCDKSKKSCFTQCRRDCSMCRGHCHDACNFKEDLCFMRCLPPVNCTEVHGLCLGNCSECQCAEECQSINCTEMAITCMDDCSPAGVGQCYTNLTQCIHNCSVCTSNNCTNCTTQCGLQYYQCMISELQQKQTPTTETSTVMTVSVLSTTASASNISSVNTTTDIPLTNTTNKQTYTNQTALNDTVIESGSNASSIDTFIVPSSNTSQNQSRDVSEVNYSRFSNCSSACSHRYTVCISSIHKVGNIPSSANLTLNLTSHRNCSDENCTSSENITSSSGNCTASSNYSCSTMNHTESLISSEDLIDCMQTLINCEVNCFMRTVPVITDCESECQSNQVSCTDRCSVCTKYCQSCQYQCDIDLHNCTVMAELLAGPLTTTLEPPTTPQPVSLEDTCADANTCWNNCYYESYKTCISCSSETEECPTLSECTDLMQDCRVTCTQTYIDPTCEDISCATLCQSKRRKRNIETVYPRIPEYVHEVDSALNTVDMKAVLDESLPSSLIKDLKRLYIALILNKASVPLYNHFKDLEDIKDTSIKYIALGTNLLDGIIDSSSHYINHIASFAQMLNRDTSFDEAFQQTVDVHDKVTGHHLERRSVSNETVDESASGNNTTHFANHTSNYTKFSNHSVSDDEHVFCISNDKYMTYINCKDNCSVKYERCVAGCLVNKTCDGNLTVNNCSSGSDSICAKNCSSNCTDVCDELRPYSHRLCYHSCENVTNCSENHGNCSRHGDANCSMAFSNVTVKNTTQCLAECDQNAEFENCSSLCDGVPCSDSTSCQCDCECTNTTVAVETTMVSVFAANATNTTSARHSNSSVNATSANVTAMGSPYEENCRCICNCVEIEADIGNYSQVFTHWRALDTNVGNLLGLEITNNTLYALSHNGLAVMRSRDYGETWVSIHPDYWSEAKMSETYIDAMSLKDEELRTVPSDENVFVSDVWNVTWGVSGVGIHFTGENRTKWELLGTWQCCGDTKP